MIDKNMIALAEVRNNYSLKKYGNLNSEQISLLKYDELCINLIKENRELKDIIRKVISMMYKWDKQEIAEYLEAQINPQCAWTPQDKEVE